MKNYIRSNWIFMLIILLLLAVIISKRSNEKTTKNDAPTFSTVTNKKDALKAIMVHDTIIKEFHSIKTITRVEQKIVIDTIKVMFKDTIPCVFDRSGGLKTELYSLNYKINNRSLELSEINIPDSLIIVTGIKRKWFLGKETNTIDVSHSNKLFYNSDVRHVEVVSKKKFYETTLFKVGVGFMAGAILVK